MWCWKGALWRYFGETQVLYMIMYWNASLWFVYVSTSMFIKPFIDLHVYSPFRDGVDVSSSQLGVFSGNTALESAYSASPQVLIRFHSDFSTGGFFILNFHGTNWGLPIGFACSYPHTCTHTRNRVCTQAGMHAHIHTYLRMCQQTINVDDFFKLYRATALST